MARYRPRVNFAVLLLLAAVIHCSPQADLPNLSTVTQIPGQSTASTLTSMTPSSASSGSPTSSYLGLSDLPTLTGVGAPTLIVPDLSGAPFMQRSTLPEGTVFICVGVALGLLGAAVLAWRTTVAYTIQRSVQRAATAPQAPYGGKGGEGKAIGMTSYRPSVFGATAGYSSLSKARESSYNKLAEHTTAYHGPGFMGSLQGARMDSNGSTSRSKKGPLRAPVTSTLFFSPTANVVPSARDTVYQSGGNTATHLPPGFYATSGMAPEPQAVPGAWHDGESPQTSPTRAGAVGNRTSTRNYGGQLRQGRVGMARAERAPSAYLEDMFESGASMRNKF